MGLNIAPSVQLNNAIFETLDKKISCVYTIECNISGNYSLDVIWFTNMGISQNFVDNYTDQIAASIEIRPIEFLNIVSNYTDLTCTITLTPVNAKTFENYDDRQPIVFTGRMLINNPKDLLKKYNIKQLIAEDENNETPMELHVSRRLPLTFQIMNKDTYNLKKKEVNSIFTNTSLDKVITHLADQFGIKNTCIKKVDNPDKIKNLVIPPGHDISSVFNYLQERYGVFGKGLRSYISNGSLHVYPGFDTEASDYKSILHVIKAPDQYILGEDGYHSYDGNDLTIVAVGGGEVSSLTESGVENVGDTQVSLQGDRMIDHISNMESDGKVNVRENTQSLTLDTKNKPQSNSVNSRYVGECVNSYNQLSNLSQTDCMIATAGWTCCEPILFNPGQKCKFHYDNEDGVYTTSNGILESINYTSSQLGHKTNKKFYTFNAQLAMRLAPAKK